MNIARCHKSRFFMRAFSDLTMSFEAGKLASWEVSRPRPVTRASLERFSFTRHHNSWPVNRSMHHTQLRIERHLCIHKLFLNMLDNHNQSRQCYKLLTAQLFSNLLLCCLVKIISPHTCFCMYSWESLISELWCLTSDAGQHPCIGDDQLLQGLQMKNVGVMFPLGHTLYTQALNRTCLRKGKINANYRISTFHIPETLSGPPASQTLSIFWRSQRWSQPPPHGTRSWRLALNYARVKIYFSETYLPFVTGRYEGQIEQAGDLIRFSHRHTALISGGMQYECILCIRETVQGSCTW